MRRSPIRAVAVLLVTVLAAPLLSTVAAGAAVVTCAAAPNNFYSTIGPGDLRAGKIESDTCLSTYAEQAGVTLTTPLQVDSIIGDPGTWLPTGSVISSQIFHVDKVGGVSPSVAYTAQLVMPSPVIALITTSSKLVGSDTRLGITGSKYAVSNRGVEAGDSVTVAPDQRTVTFNLSSLADVDDVRVITGTRAALKPTSTALTLSATSIKVGSSVSMTAQVTQGASGAAPTGTVAFKDGAVILSTKNLTSGQATFSTSALSGGAHTLTATYSGDASWASSTSAAATLEVRVPPVCTTDKFVPITQPLNLTQGVWESDSCLFTLDEQNVVLAAPLTLDRPGTTGGPTTLAAGRRVSSTLIHVDKLANTTTSVAISGSRTFPHQIAGLITTSAKLSSSDPILAPAGATFATTANRGLEAADVVTIAPDARTVNFSMSAVNGVDDIRVIMVNTPPVCAPSPVDVDEDVLTTVTVSCSDPDGDAVTYSVVSGLHATGSIVGNQLSIVSDANYNGPGSVTLQASDGNDTTTFVVPVNFLPVDDAPTCSPVPVQVAQSGSVTFSVSCTDPDGDELALGLVSPPAHGVASTDMLSVTYAHDGSSATSDSIALEVTDGVFSVPVTVPISVVAARGLITAGQPSATADSTYRYIGSKFIPSPTGTTIVGLAFPYSGQAYATSFQRIDANQVADLSFGTNGVVRQLLPAGLYPSAVVLDEQGKVLTLASDGTILRYLANGTLDAPFGGGDGRSDALTLPANFTLSSMFEATAQPDGKIVAIGQGWMFNDYNHQWAVVARYNANGSIDTSFGTNGLYLREATWPSSGCSSSDPYTRLRIDNLTLQADGKIVAAGTHHWCGTDRVMAIRLNTDGTPDAGFGVGGMTQDPGTTYGAGTSVWMDGANIVVAGNAVYSGGGAVIHRYLPNGTLDTSFAGTGRVVVGAGLISPDVATPDGNGGFFFAGADTQNSGQQKLAVMHLDSDGDVDLSFGVNGRVTVAVGPIGSYGARQVAMIDSTTVGIVGYSGATSPGDVAAFNRFDATSGAPV